MKIGILTQRLHANYGGLLQNYALQQVLLSNGHTVRTLDWKNVSSKTLKDQLCELKMSLLAILFPSRYKAWDYQLTYKEEFVIERNINYFVNKFIKHTRPAVSLGDFRLFADEGGYEAYIVGSDQCWRPKYNAFLPAMFLSFVEDKNVKRISYGASFGTDDWEFSPFQTSFCASLVQKFDRITVREDAGVKLCKEYFGIEPMQVLDPTLLLLKEDYINLIEAEKEPKMVGSLFTYFLDPNSEKKVLTAHLENTLKLSAFQVLPKYQIENRTKFVVKHDIENCVYPRVTTWLRAFMDAEMILVDSFHGMVFSIIFNKPFWVIGNAGRGMCRFTSLLKLLHLEDRLIDVSKLDLIDFHKTIDWDSVNSILADERERCKTQLLSSLE